MSRPAEPKPNTVPQIIRLPDGREYSVKDLLKKPQNRRSYNLRTGMEFGHRTRQKIPSKRASKKEI